MSKEGPLRAEIGPLSKLIFSFSKYLILMSGVDFCSNYHYSTTSRRRMVVSKFELIYPYRILIYPYS
jgi:hypothetical protein